MDIEGEAARRGASKWQIRWQRRWQGKLCLLTGAIGFLLGGFEGAAWGIIVGFVVDFGFPWSPD